MNKLYSVHDHWTDIDKKNDVDIESIDGVITGIKVNGEDYGGSEYQNIYDNTINTVLDDSGFYRTTIGVVIEADSIRVTFDGVEYSCPKRNISGVSTNFYGAPTPAETEESFDWTDFPFSIASGINGASTVVITQTAGLHTLKIDIPQSGGSSDFSTAEVTFICTGDNPSITTQFINIQEDGIYGVLNITQSTQTVTVPLYKNKLSCDIPPFYMSVTSISGNIAGSQMDGYIISGNCTINYTLPM